ncbi:VOC family protein [Roseomonas eburnea]|uniref:VOC family protein n=1 Tax=Neoroseomonas eburnea TaxID=1346889 RepID=A0A9X9X8M9_9PROT|nr:VOC family protein [Neoroseomonas eburnea]MBR0680065.1 VOC family protein [Neoroseomonas eburnea]
MQVQPYLFLNGRCEEAIAFWQKAVGATPGMVLRFRDNPEPSQIPPGSEDRIMHASIKVGATEILASDGCAEGAASFAGFSLAFTADSVGEAERTFATLSEGGQVQMPMAKTFFAATFGVVQDRFGVSWMVLAEA